jgi:uncharacterized protein (TIGR00288 family)
MHMLSSFVRAVELRLSTLFDGKPSSLTPQQLTMERIAEQLQRIDAKVEAPRAKLYACLVDAENSQASKLVHVVSELSGYGEVQVRRMYGDFSQQTLLPWKAVSNELSFRPQAQFSIIPGKGSSDMAMAMDAIDLLHDDRLHIDGFALVSSDSDFTPLASKLREDGRHVIGFGRRTTPTPFVNACHTFVHLENLGTHAGASPSPMSADSSHEDLSSELKVSQDEYTMLARASVLPPPRRERETLVARASVLPPQPLSKATRLKGTLKGLDLKLNEALEDIAAGALYTELTDQYGQPWVDISLLVPALRRRNPSWDLRNYGVTKSKGLTGLLGLDEVSKLFTIKKFGKFQYDPTYIKRR